MPGKPKRRDFKYVRLLELPVVGGYAGWAVMLLPRFARNWASTRSRSVRQRSSSSRSFSTRTSFTGWPDPTIFNVNVRWSWD